jgi:hypothetical protein
VQTGHRHRKREERILIGISINLGVLRVKGHAHWMIVQVVKEARASDESERKNI